MNDLAKKAYEAYWAVMAHPSASGPVKFEQLNSEQRQGWIAAANAVEQAISVERVP